MKGFFKKRWHGIPIGILSIILALMLVGGSIFAALTVFNGNAEVTVEEAITVTNTDGDDHEFFTGGAMGASWDVSLYAGETKTLNVLVSNASSVDLTIGLVFASSHGAYGVTSSVSGSSTVPGGGSVTLTLTVSAAQDASPGSYTIYFAISRG